MSDTPKIVIRTERLRSGQLYARPNNTLGTCGFHPKAWTIAAVRQNEHPVTAFLRFNPNWSREEIE